jgi:anti-sigma regulatory factor (Ser/Thr protein kinase)/Na+-translocating ferredoxin:NAD+ oxidoreductase RNF subunit RnfB
VELFTFDIESNDFRGAGAASRAVKEHLKRVGADAESIRRTMIATYEAEMNVVIHANHGRLNAWLTDTSIAIDVVDEGPGIPDVELAMQEGYSTAKAEARALGFGAGMGLPNIRRSSDRLRVTSRVGEGTRVSFTVHLRTDAATSTTRPPVPLSLYVMPGRCTDCRRCLAACPTQALRVRNSRPVVLEHLCIDCAACIEACGPRALTVRNEMDGIDDLPDRREALLAVPPALLSGCGPRYSPRQVLGGLGSLGFSDVTTSARYEAALRSSVLEFAAKRQPAFERDAEPNRAPGDRAPAISPACPAVVNLLELKFPSLLPHLAPFASPWEALQTDHAERRVAYTVSCPAQRSALLLPEYDESELSRDSAKERRSDRPATEFLVPMMVRSEVLRQLSVEMEGRGQGCAVDVGRARRSAPPEGRILTVTGIEHVLAVLEEAEDGLLSDVDALEPFACTGGCFGSPLLAEDHHIALRRWLADGDMAIAPEAGDLDGGRPGRMPAAGAPRRRPYVARPGIRLDADITRAIAKLGRLQQIIASLPGTDCSACGAPSCAAFAEDVVLARAGIALCPHAVLDEVST